MTVFPYRQPPLEGKVPREGTGGMKEDAADGKTFLHKSLLTKAPERRFALIFIKGDIRKWWGSDTGETHFQHTGEANPVSLRQAAPSRGRGENVERFECIDPSFLWKEVPAGRRLGAQSGVNDDVRLSNFLGKHGSIGVRLYSCILMYSELCKDEAMHKNSCRS